MNLRKRNRVLLELVRNKKNVRGKELSVVIEELTFGNNMGVIFLSFAFDQEEYVHVAKLTLYHKTCCKWHNHLPPL